MYMMHLPVKDVIRKHLIMIQRFNMILDGQCGQFNPILLKCLKELSTSSFQKCLVPRWMIINIIMKYRAFRMKYSVTDLYRIQIYSQSVIKVLQEKIDFFKTNSGMNSIDYNAVSGQLTDT